MSAAEQHFKSAVGQEPSNADYHFELANVYASQYDQLFSQGVDDKARPLLDLAEQELRQTLMIRPEDVPAMYNLGVVFKRQGDFEGAREQFRKVLVLDAASLQAQMQIGASYEEQGFFDEARDEYKKARDFDYYNPDILTAIEDLNRREAESKLAGQGQMQRRMDFLHAQLRQARLGQLSSGQQVNSDAGEGASIAQLVPYLGAMIAQQFLQARNRKSAEV